MKNTSLHWHGSKLWLLAAVATVAAAIFVGLVDAFPESQNPFAAGPPIALTNNKHKSSPCRISLFQNASLDSYSTISKFPFSPSHCNSKDNEKEMTTTTRFWDRIILQVQGHVAGVQYDRVGALWINGVELLRMTTPEPTAEGIEWKVERDVTMYASLFQEGEVQVQIPNNVNKIYTGVIYLSAQLLMYQSEGVSLGERVPIADYVLSLTNPPQHQDAWSSMAISGGQSKPANITMPAIDATRAHIDLYASGHGCEEFWYTNPPDAIANEYGMCGGGSSREIQLLIDGQVAGIQPPFPVVYTGGINPLLWRPQTGIYSFNIPPYFFDISPFLPKLRDGKPHEIEVKIIGNSIKGQWNVDPVLVIFNDNDAMSSSKNKDTYLRSNPHNYQFFQRGPKVVITNSSSLSSNTTNITWTEEFESELVIEAIDLAGKSTRVSAKTTSIVTNSLVGESLQLTTAHLESSLASSAYNRIEHFEYPSAVTTDYKESNGTFLIDAEVDQTLYHTIGSYNANSSLSQVHVIYQDNIEASATYNRSTGADRTAYIQRGKSHQSTYLGVAGNTCFDQVIGASHGYVTSFKENQNNGKCHVPLSFCSVFDVCSPEITNSSSLHFNQDLFVRNDVYDGWSDLPLRHPRSISKEVFLDIMIK